VPQVVAVALLGAAVYAGFRWLARAAGSMAEEMRRAEEALKAKGRIEKDLGTLEYDAASGVYRPARRD
jgi:hypothetical protein